MLNPVDGMDELPTRERLVLAAMKLFGEKGYLSTSVQDILREAGANAGSLYHFFPTKQDVLVAVLDMYRAGIEPMLLAPAWANRAGWTFVSAATGLPKAAWPALS